MDMDDNGEPQPLDVKLPPDLQIEILLRLPVRSLSRFRRVCRTWNSVITSHRFISLHLDRSTQRGGDSSSLLLHYSLTRRKDLYAVYRDGESSFDELQQLDFPIKSYDTYFYVASCNGLLCFSDYLINYLRVVLWNPSIRKSVKVPVPRFMDTDVTHTYVLGFGFDCKTSDYKVVRLIYALGKNSAREVPPEVEIFELRRYKWRSIDTYVPYVVSDTSQAFVNGGVHWLGYRPDHQLRGDSLNVLIVVVLDVHDEVFNELEIPSDVVHIHLPNLSVAVRGKSLCLLQLNPWMEGRQPMEGICSIWEMKQYGVKESWTRQFNVDMRGLGGLGRVLGFRKHGDILVVNSGNELVSYDPKNQKTESLGLQGILRSFQAINYMESLVLLEGEGGHELLGKTSSSGARLNKC